LLSNALFLALRSLYWYRGRAITIILCLATTLWVPFTVRMLVREFQDDILERAESTPLIIGKLGSRIDLVLHGLYFQSAPPEALTMREADYVRKSGFASAIPLHIRFRTQDVQRASAAPVVGTTLEYFEFRQLRIAEGQTLVRLGDCVLGARFAARSGLKPGDRLLTAPQNAFNLAGDYPMNLRVTGVLNISWSPDDDAVFVDIRTAWIIEGIGHGHQALSAESKDQLLEGEGSGPLKANASVLPYTEITDENESSFHFHGIEADFPVTEVLAVPHDRKSQTLLLGRYASVRRSAAICVKPRAVVGELLGMVFRIEQLFRVVAVLSAAVTGVLLTLVVFLSVRLRAPEMRTMQRIGSARGTIALLVGTEVSMMLAIAICLSLVAASGTRVLAGDWLRQFLF
jgi:putative ABC transport system permease protein